MSYTCYSQGRMELFHGDGNCITVTMNEMFSLQNLTLSLRTLNCNIISVISQIESYRIIKQHPASLVRIACSFLLVRLYSRHQLALHFLKVYRCLQSCDFAFWVSTVHVGSVMLSLLCTTITAIHQFWHITDSWKFSPWRVPYMF